jgi:hypothetical protein
MSIESSLDFMSPVEVVISNNNNNNDLDSTNSKIPPLLLRSPPSPPPSHLSRSNSPNVQNDDNNQHEHDIVDQLPQPPSIISANTNFNIDFAFDLNNYDENNKVDEEEQHIFNTNAHTMLDNNLSAENIDEKPFEFSNLDNDKSANDDDSDWANFDFKQPTNLNVNTSEINAITLEPKDTQKIENASMKNVPTAQIEDDDDEWADFVDNTNASNILNIPNETINNNNKDNDDEGIEKPDENQNAPILEAPKLVNQKEFVDHLNVDDLVNKLFTNFNLNISNDNEETNSSDTFKELLIDEDDTWQQLKAYTSVIDASISLQFKWDLSYLEEKCLNSLNLDKIKNIQVKF